MKFWLSDQDVMHKTNMTTRETIVPIAAPTIHFRKNPNPINQKIIDDINYVPT
jgi:hypothetical protein